jgi:hypothetical protein
MLVQELVSGPCKLFNQCIHFLAQLYIKSSSFLQLYIPRLTLHSDCAEKHPEATVKGIDISPIQPPWVPPNAYFEIDDFNLDWIDTNKYDLIHQRELLGSVPDWDEFYNKCFKYVSPSLIFSTLMIK